MCRPLMTARMAQSLLGRNQRDIEVTETASNRRDNGLLIGGQGGAVDFAGIRAHSTPHSGPGIDPPPAHPGASLGLSWSIRPRISANNVRGTATSASWSRAARRSVSERR